MEIRAEDVEVNWNGRKRGKKSNCSDGVYFYVCTVKESRLDGLHSYQLRGTVSLIRGEPRKAN